MITFHPCLYLQENVTILENLLDIALWILFRSTASLPESYEKDLFDCEDDALLHMSTFEVLTSQDNELKLCWRNYLL